MAVAVSCLLSPDGGIGRRWSQTPVGAGSTRLWYQNRFERSGFFFFYHNEFLIIKSLLFSICSFLPFKNHFFANTFPSFQNG
jgi:hypothetical protein